MIAFYCIDGPRKGQLIYDKDFKPYNLSDGTVYYKHTFVVKHDNLMYTDVASIDRELKSIEVNEHIPFYFRNPFTTSEKPF